MKLAAGIAAVMTVTSLAACTASHRASTPSRTSALHAAAQCVRTHGVPAYQDPVIGADGHVYTDIRALHRLSAAQFDAIRRACGNQLAAAGFGLKDEPPAPPHLVQAGVRTARCLRAHGLPNYRDPTSSTHFTPGHGFDMTPDELPGNGAGGKGDVTVQRAFAACRHEQDAEIAASTLSSLAHDFAHD